MGDVAKVFHISLHDAIFGLSDILLVTAFAVDQVVAFASNMYFGIVGPLGSVTGDGSRSVHSRTISA